MLRPLKGKGKRRRFCTYDLEWVPGNNPEKALKAGLSPLELRLVGVYDGRRFRHYTTIRDFLNGELTPENDGMWFYAHAGGLYDIRWVMEYLIDHQNPLIQVDAKFSGSSAIIVRVKKGERCWYFLDSYWLIRQSLRKIGKWMGRSKGGEQDSTDIFYAPMSELIDYNRLDCVILWEAIRYFEKVLLGLGGQLEMTVASSAMSLFRRAFLHRTLDPVPKTNEIARQAYVASRVEVYERYCNDADYYDVNSSFPYAMTFDAPGNLINVDGDYADSGIQIVSADVTIPDCYIPPLPYRTDDRRIYFPTGNWHGWFSNVDLELLQETPGARINRVYESLHFESFGDLKAYAETIYALRKASKSEAEKAVLKILLNSLYGKFAEGNVKGRFIVNPPKSFFTLPKAEPGKPGISYVMPGVYEQIEHKIPPHCHVPVAMHITAIARAVLTRFMWQGSRVFYCDTDGFGVPSTDRFETSEELGGLKNEKHIHRGIFAAPKLYAYQESEDGDWSIKAKGFSRLRGHRYQTRDGEEWIDEGDSRPISYEDFVDLLEHKELYVESFSRLKGGLKKQSISPSEILQTKRLRGSVRPKRAFHDDGTSRAWNVDELHTRWRP